MTFKEKSLSQIVKAVLPMAGPGTRLRPFTYSQPKHLMKIAGKPLIEYVFNTLTEAGIVDVGLVVGYKKDQIIECLGNGSKFGVHITYIVQDELKGIADAVLRSEHFVGKDPFVVYLSDTLIPNGIKEHVESFLNSRSNALILTAMLPRSELSSAGTVQVDGDKVVKLEEKAIHPKSNLALAGVYFFNSPEVFNVIRRIRPSKRGELEITDAIQRLVDEGHVVYNQVIQGEYIDAGSYGGLLKANRHVSSRLLPMNEGKLERGVIVKGKVHICQGSIIRKNSRILGPAYIGRNCHIGPSTIIGPYVSIDDNVTVQGGTVKDAIIMEQSQLRLKGTLSKSIVGRNIKAIQSGKPYVRKCTLILGDSSFAKF